MSDFLPKDYKEPVAKTSNYMKFEEGANKFRILGKPIMGWEYWTNEGDKRRPNRVREFKDVPNDMREDARFFWVFPVWNYVADKVQVLEITQASIRRTIEGLSNDESWGSPMGYDLTVNRVGEGLETEYTVIPSPPTEFVTKGREIPNINLDVWMENGDPFSSDAISSKELDAVADEITEDLDSEGSED